ncbi:condensation domain-containing protein [Kribbella sp. NPDC056861]|uniref:condensation domain-containing protein n=1 Tax=Kribbella sp. NPDC056861 TaxID=3154857 RepID=UPI00341CFE00
MITESTAQVEFFGGKARVAPLAWGQQASWDVMQDWLLQDKPFFVVTRWQSIPLLLGLPDVLAVLGELMIRHEGLRTLYHATDRGDAQQEVLASGSVGITVFDRPAEDPVEFSTIVTNCLARAEADHFDHDTEVPVRFYVAMHQGIPVLVVFGVSHLSADYTSADVVSADLAALLQARADGTDVPAVRPALQPADLAAYENSPEGQMLNVEALGHLREQLRQIPETPLPTRHEPVSPRYFRGELESSAIPVAVRVAARRHRTTTSVVLLSITTALFRNFAPGPAIGVDLMQGNRGSAESMHSVSSLNQAVRTALELTGRSFEDLLRQSEFVTTIARRRSRYDARAAAEVFRVEAERRGVEPEPACQFNDMWSTLPRPSGRPDSSPAELDRLVRESSFDWPQKSEIEGSALFLDTRGTAERIKLSLMADTALLSPGEIQGFLFAFEQTAVLLASSVPSLEQISDLFAGYSADASVAGRSTGR